MVVAQLRSSIRMLKTNENLFSMEYEPNTRAGALESHDKLVDNSISRPILEHEGLNQR